MRTLAPVLFLSLGLLTQCLLAGDAEPQPKTPTKPKAPRLAPTQENVAYGTHPQQVLDFYKAESAKPTPLLFFIHGGGWKNGDKTGFNDAVWYVKAGISVVSINYRHIQHAEEAGIVPPVKAPLEDAARALQFVRSKAAEWNLDQERIGASGSSAGACSSLWLAFHPEMADANSADPVARESTRLWCAAVIRAQTTLDPQQMVTWTPNSSYGPHAFGFKGDPAKNLTPFAQFLAEREKILPWLAEYSPYALVSSDDPPVYLAYDTPPEFGQPQKSTSHTANFGVGLIEKLKSEKVAFEFVYPGSTDVKHADMRAYLVDVLKGPRPKP